MRLTQEQEMRRAEFDAAGKAYAAAGARFLESLRATDAENEEAQDQIADGWLDHGPDDIAGYEGWVAHYIADERENGGRS